MKYENTKTDIHQEITNQIIDLLDQVDINDYQPPFAQLAAQGLPYNPTTGNHYQGINVLSLWFNQQVRKFPSNQFATFKQWQENGMPVRKGERGSRVIFYKTLLKSEANDKGIEEEKRIPMLRCYTVFNASQVEGYVSPEARARSVDKVERIHLIDEFCRSIGADIRTGGHEAYYTKEGDFINMPPTSEFLETSVSATEQYYSTLLHEITHWTGAGMRLDRPGITEKSKTREVYAFEELVAEIGAAFLCAQHGITQTQPKNHAIYIKSWLQALKDDKKLIFSAAADAARATDYLNTIAGTNTEEKIVHEYAV